MGLVCAPPAPQEFKQCIWIEGDAMCPTPSPYTERTVRYEDFEDDRACSECTCGSPDGVCEGPIIGFSNSNCSIGLDNETSDGESSVCLVDSNDGNTPNFVAARVNVDPVAACPASGGTLSGEVTETGATTICCTP